METAVGQPGTTNAASANGHVANGHYPNGLQDLVTAPVAPTPAAPTNDHPSLEAELRLVRASMERLEQAQLRHSHALVAVATQWTEQLNDLRTRAEGIGGLSEAERTELLGRLDAMQTQLTRLDGFAIQTAIQERMINELEAKHARTAESLSQLASTSTELSERVDQRFEDMKKRYDSRYHTLAVGVILAMLVTAWLGFSTAYLWVSR